MANTHKPKAVAAALAAPTLITGAALAGCVITLTGAPLAGRTGSKRLAKNQVMATGQTVAAYYGAVRAKWARYPASANNVRQCLASGGITVATAAGQPVTLAAAGPLQGQLVVGG